MKAVQIGILAALVVCVGLLYKVYRGQQAAPVPVAAAVPAQTQTAVVPAPSTAAQTAPAPAPKKPKPAAYTERKPSPARRLKRAAGETPAERGAGEHAAPGRPGQSVEPGEPAGIAQNEPEPAIPVVSGSVGTEAAVQQQPERSPQLNPPAGAQTAAASPRVAHVVTIPAGTLIPVRLSETLSSDRNRPGDTFSATLAQPLVVDGFEIAQLGAHAQGKVIEAQKAGRVKGLAALEIQLTLFYTEDGQDIAIETQPFTKQGPTSHREDAEKIGGGAVIGAIIGAVAGGGKGAAIGAGAGGAAGGGVAVATRGKPADLPVETRISFRLQAPVTLTERIQ